MKRRPKGSRHRCWNPSSSRPTRVEPREQAARARARRGSALRVHHARHRGRRARRSSPGASRAARCSRRPRSAARERLSQNAIEPGSQWNRHWNSGERTWSKRNGRSSVVLALAQPDEVRRRVAVHEQRLAPGLGVGHHHAVLDRRAPLLHLRQVELGVAVARSPCASAW